MKRKQIIFLTIFIVCLITAIAGYNYVFNAQHRDISQEAITTSLSAIALQTRFVEDEALATSSYLDNVMAVKGTISGIDGRDVILSDRVHVTLQPKELNTLTLGKFVTIKGRCIGFDALLEMVRIDQATLIKNESTK